MCACVCMCACVRVCASALVHTCAGMSLCVCTPVLVCVCVSACLRWASCTRVYACSCLEHAGVTACVVCEWTCDRVRPVTVGVHVSVSVRPQLGARRVLTQSHPWVTLGPGHSPRSGWRAVWPLATVTQQEGRKEQDSPPGHLTAPDAQPGGGGCLASRGQGPSAI